MTIIQRGPNTFRINVFLGRDAKTKKKIQDTVTFHGTFREAEAEERRLLRKRDLGAYPTPTTITVWEWLDRWLSDVKPDVAGSTYEGYARCADRYIKPNVDEQLKLRKFRPEDVKDLYATLREAPARGGGKLSAHTVLHVHRVLRQALKAAVVERILAVNPAEAVRAPRREEKEMKAITEAQTAALLRGLQGTRYHVPVMVAVTCGLRRGELLGLRWRDVDFGTKVLTVMQVVEQTKEGGVALRSGPKTKKSRRPVAIPPFVVAALKVHKAEQNERKLEQGNTWKDNDLVFPAPSGAPWSPSYFSRMFSYHAHRLGIDCRLHDLRHSHATQLLGQGINAKVVSERLGHSTVAFTLNTYAHVIEGMDQAAARKIGTALQSALAKADKAR
jgi:integrase